jgi:hypothetical protein
MISFTDDPDETNFTKTNLQVSNTGIKPGGNEPHC